MGLFGFSDVKTCLWMFQQHLVLHKNQIYFWFEKKLQATPEYFFVDVLRNNHKVYLWRRNLFASNSGISVCGCSKDKVVEDRGIGGHPNASSYHHRHLVMIIVMMIMTMLMVMMERRRRAWNKKWGRFDFIKDSWSNKNLII